MNINHSLAIIIRSLLEKRSKQKDFKKLDFFSKEELNEITELEITNSDNLDDIDKLPNLKRVIIRSENYNNFASYIELEENPLINHIEDFSRLENLTDLEELKIINDINIKEINLEKLINLKKLYLINNPNLSVVNNLEKLKNIEKIIIYGTNVKNPINIDEYIVSTFNAKTNILDINMYNSIVKGSNRRSKAFSNLYKLGFNKIKFAEKTGFADFALLNPAQVNEVFQNCYSIIKEKQLETVSDYEKIKQVYQYVIENITFDNDGIIARNKQFLEANINRNNIPPHLKNNFSMLHSSYNAGILRKSNCEGYVNLMNFMLRMLNIDAASVYATDKKNNRVASYNHALTSVKFNDNWYYFEPTWEQIGEFKYFMKTYDEISETHILNPLELLKNKEVNFNVNNHTRNRKFQ